nr:penicillin-binding protein activator LpoB [Treponemataceae bacterium]
MIRRTVLSAAAVMAALIFSSCATTKVTRVDSGTATDLSGYWNDTDVRIAADGIISACLSSPRIQGYPAAHGGRLPVVIVGSYRNMSDEHIDTEILTKKLEAALVNSGAVDFVASASERGEIRAERAAQQYNSSEATAK